MALAYSLHVTDVRANLVAGARTLTLTLLSWLLPVMTLFAVLFVLALPVVGLEPLWATRRATADPACIGGGPGVSHQRRLPGRGRSTRIALLLRQSRWLAAIVIVPLAVLAGYGVLLRVEQYGWTPAQRVIAAACVTVAACYATGYALAAILSRLALRQLELTNVLTACVIIAVLLALLSPIADPARISVIDQINRLNSGRTAPDKFDFAFLQFRAGRYGKEALQRLGDGTEGPRAPLFAERAKDALRADNEYRMRRAHRRSRHLHAR